MLAGRRLIRSLIRSVNRSVNRVSQPSQSTESVDRSYERTDERTYERLSHVTNRTSRSETRARAGSLINSPSAGADAHGSIPGGTMKQLPDELLDGAEIEWHEISGRKDPEGLFG